MPMSWFTRVLRLVVGGALVAGGAVLAQPFVQTVLAARQQVAASAGGPPLDVWRAPLPGMQMFPADGGGRGGAWPSASHPMQATPAAPLGGGAAGFAPQGIGFDGASALMPSSQPPPAPPAPLPRSAIDVGPAAPALDAAYRSTLDIPPPPLLDTQTPPPLAVGWSTHDAQRPAVAAAAAVEAPSTYVVRDGDDLTGIALRVYGSAGAATAIWAANRDRLADPQLLPIGMVLRMPPSWTLPSAHAGQAVAGGQAIEPAFGAAAPTAASWRATRPAADQRGGGSAAWLQQPEGASGGYDAGRPDAGRAAAVQPPEAAGALPTTVRVAAGDTLESIAVRVYGDRTAAAHIWQANRDRLRSPDLLVPGTDLRLP
jgi:nucleoid-associated protein YgaU